VLEAKAILLYREIGLTAFFYYSTLVFFFEQMALVCKLDSREEVLENEERLGFFAIMCKLCI